MLIKKEAESVDVGMGFNGMDFFQHTGMFFYPLCLRSSHIPLKRITRGCLNVCAISFFYYRKSHYASLLLRQRNKEAQHEVELTSYQTISRTNIIYLNAFVFL